MFVRVALAALAAIPAVLAQDVSSSATRCTTRYGYYPLPTGTAAVPTWYKYTTTTNMFRVTYTTRDTVTVTPSATTFTDVVTTTATFSETVTSTPSPSTVAAPASFMPVLAGPLAGPTQVSRIKRHALGAHDAETGLRMLRRQTAANSTGGYSVNRDGEGSDMYKIYPHEVRCRISVTVNSTTTTIVTGLPETEVAGGPTARVQSTSTISTTTTVTVVAPRQTKYAACDTNNVVSSVMGFNNRALVFYQVEYGAESGYDVEKKLIVNTTSAENCCIACQNTNSCAGDFYVPSKGECHMHLTQKPSLALPAPGPYGNSSAVSGVASATDGVVLAARQATGTGSAVGPLSTGTTEPTCPEGSMTMYVGTIKGTEDFPEDYALHFSNGPCGYFGIYPLDVEEGVPVTPDDEDFKRKLKRALQ